MREVTNGLAIYLETAKKIEQFNNALISWIVIGTTELVKIPGFEGTIEDLFEELNADSTVAMMNSQKGFTVSMMMKK